MEKIGTIRLNSTYNMLFHIEHMCRYVHQTKVLMHEVLKNFDSWWDTLSGKRKLACPLCQSTEFEKQEGKMDSKWGFTAHKITMMICKNCRFIMSFSKGRTVWDFD